MRNAARGGASGEHVEKTWPVNVGPEGMTAHLAECYPDAEAVEEIAAR